MNGEPSIYDRLLNREPAPRSDAARAKVQQAIRTGRLQKPTNFACVDCGLPATEYDHRDYKKPLEVQPVCRRCNRRRGPGLNKNWDKPKSKAS